MTPHESPFCSVGSSSAPAGTNPNPSRLSRAFPLLAPAFLLAFVLLPRVREEAGLIAAFVAAAVALWAWAGILVFRRRPFQMNVVAPLRSHYVQAVVQTTLYAYWGWYWPAVGEQVPLILAQIVFLYGFDALISWSRGRSWRMTCGPLPIVLSTNVFLWFEDEVFVLQFAMLAVGALGKEFVTWTKDGRRTHVFNPSGLGLTVAALALIATGMTSELSLAGRIADSFSYPPQIYLVIFLLGLVVQHFFAITLMTVSAVVALTVLNLAYTEWTGTYYFIFSNLPAPVFLGLHLLVTDPSTSPRTTTGRILCGASYGALSFVFYGVLSHIGAPSVYDKLLPIPILNASIRMFDRISMASVFGWVSRLDKMYAPRTRNIVHMSGWSVFFCSMMATGYLQGPHEGSTYQFWRRALDEGRPNAGHGLVEVVKSHARDGSAAAWNELGLMHLEGELVEHDPQRSAQCFARAMRMGSVGGAANLLTQFLQQPNARGSATIEQAFEVLERAYVDDADGSLNFLLGLAYGTGHGRPHDKDRARRHLETGAALGSRLARQALGQLDGGR